jgi:hypothetical protein
LALKASLSPPLIAAARNAADDSPERALLVLHGVP